VKSDSGRQSVAHTHTDGQTESQSVVSRCSQQRHVCLHTQHIRRWINATARNAEQKKRKGSPYSITQRRVPELIPVLGSQPAGDVSHKPGGRLPLLSARPAVTSATLKRAATNFAGW